METLIRSCLCDNSFFSSKTLNGIPCNVCDKCGVIHQRVEMNETQYADFYKSDYHTEHQREIGRPSYNDRYEHDRSIASKRIEVYEREFPSRPTSKWLDIGSGNGAFVDELQDRGWRNSWGIDPNPQARVLFRNYAGSLESAHFPTGSFERLTMHDVLEHVVDPRAYLKECHRILKKGGLLIVDFPDFHVAEGIHHWRMTQHLWMLNRDQLADLLRECGFHLDLVTKPIASKLVFYARKAQLEKPKTVLVIPGIGDIYWCATKLQSLIKKEKLGIPDVHVWNFDGRPRSGEFIERMPFVRFAGYWNQHVMDSQKKVFEDSYLRNGPSLLRDFYGYDYYLCVNGELRNGKSMEEILPHYETNWDFPLHASLEERMMAQLYKGKGKYVVGCFSKNGMFRNWIKQFGIGQVVEVLRRIKQAGYTIYLTGSHWDMEFNQELEALIGGGGVINLCSETNLTEFMALLRGASGVVGWCGGNTIVAAALKIPTVILWSYYFPHPRFYQCACPPDVLGKTYFPMIVEAEKGNTVADQCLAAFH